MFLNQHGWSVLHPVGQDSSIRRYFRVSNGKQTAILMETVPDGSSHATPGHGLNDFVRIDEWLGSVGLKAPEIYEYDQETGYILMEDFGEVCFKQAITAGRKSKSIYVLAARVLEHLSKQECTLELPDYYESHVHKRHRRVMDWYAPFIKDKANEAGAIDAYYAAWEEVESKLSPCPQGFLHIDFHAENLMWLPSEIGLKRCGILDFQGAMKGPIPYDLANLLEDARTDVPKDLRDRILSRFDENMRGWYRVLATQFHCRVIGQFIKQAVVDNNTSYLPHIGRLQNYLHEGLKDPVLAPLAGYFKEQGVKFDETADFDRLNGLRALVGPDAQ